MVFTKQNEIVWPLMGETITWSDRLKMAYFALSTKKFTNGERVKKFEYEWNQWLGSKYSLYVSSGSTANLLLVDAIKEKYRLKNGDKVLVPACTWVTNVAPIIQLGLTPIFCDVNLSNFSFDVNHAYNIAREHKDIKLVFTTHLLGFSGENETIKSLFRDALFIDDVCESHGALDDRNRKIGSNSLGATFSFYFGHHMSTIEGGMISTNDVDLFDLMRMKRSHGMARESITPYFYSDQYPEIDKQFLFMTNGYNFRNHEICAVLGSSQLKRLDSMIERRRNNHKLFCEIIDQYPNLFYNIKNTPGNSSFCLPFICKKAEDVKEMKLIFSRYGIEYRPIVSGNLLKQPFLKDKGYSLEPGSNNNIDVLHNQGVYIGNNHFIDDYDMDFLRDILRKINVRSNF
jgi:CDP-6-deoxy-D-xylo-4-hexulose-3-dehydrase